jgi:hypothetical protein
MKNFLKSYILFLFPLVSVYSSCKKFVQIPTPKNQLTSTTVFADSLGANAAVAGIYVNMMQTVSLTFTNGGITLYTGLAGDELYQSKTNVSNNEFYNNAITINNGINAGFWRLAYQYIYDTNACIEGIESGNNITPSAKNSLEGEAKLIRAFLYFNLINLYGPVPLVTNTNYESNQSIGRSEVDVIYTQIISDLKFAQAYLPKNSVVNTRANYYAATALLAKVYLFKGDYPNAITEADKIINSGNYMLVTDLNAAFLAGSKETLWSFAPVSVGKQTWEGYFFVPTTTSATPAYIITNSLYNSFETGDLRKSAWINKNVVSGQTYPYPYKYKKGTTTGTSTENYVIFRLAEQYLIEAESRANNNDLNGALANLNIIRKRAGLPNYSTSDKTSLLLAIEKEWQHEMFCEWGNRWFDLIRTNRANAILGVEKPNWKNSSSLFPIPQQEITFNPNLKQNSGY